MRRRRLGGFLLTAGALLILTGILAIAADLWPDEAITATAFALYVLVFVVPGLVLMAIGAKLGHRDPR